MVQSIQASTANVGQREQQSSMTITLYTARHVFPVSAEPIADGTVAAENGRIVAVGTAADLRERYPSAKVVNLEGYALLPGLVNAHTHLELTRHAGHVPENLPLIEWIGPLVRYSRTRTPEDFERAGYAGVECCGPVARLQSARYAPLGRACAHWSRVACMASLRWGSALIRRGR